MPNYCSNSVLFIGDASAVTQVRELFAEIQRKQTSTNRYHLPDFVTGGTGYMEDIEPGTDWIAYETRWVPNLEVLEQIARRFDLEFIARYNEQMSGLKGAAVFTNDETRFFNFFSHLKNTPDEQRQLQEILSLQEQLLNKNGLQR